MNTRRSIELVLVATAFVLLLAVVGIVGSWQVVAARSAQRTQIEDGGVNAAHLAASALGSALSSRLELLSNLGAQPQAATIFTKDTPELQAQIAAALHMVYPGFSSFLLIDTTGRVDARWPDAAEVVGKSVASQPYFQAVLQTGKPYISQAEQQTAPPRELVTLLAAPVRDANGKITGIMGATLSGSGLASLIGGTDLRPGGTVLVLDQTGHPLTGPAASATQTYRSLPAVTRALARGSGFTTGAVPGFGGTRLIGYSQVPAAGWVVLAERPISVLDKPVTAMTERLIAIGLVVVAAAVGTIVFITSLLRRLSRERYRADAVIASVGEGVITMDHTGIIQTVNPAMQELTRGPASELIGKQWLEAVSLYDERGALITWDESIAARALTEDAVVATTGYEEYLAQPDGQRVPISVTAAPLRAGDERLGVVVVLRDVSREREVDQLKSSLVSTVSHELRTPLTMIQGFSELLLSRGDLDDQRSREALDHIHGSTRRLSRLIDDLLSVSRIDSGKLTVESAPLDVADVVWEVAETLGSPRDRGYVDFNSAKGRLRVDVPADLPLVIADRDKLVQILVNLISNALKYSEAPTPVTVTALARDHHVEISVTDEGIGMTETECRELFEKFTRSDRPEVRHVNGSGLGLYITKSLVELQHGQIWVTSEFGRGSVFTFALPLTSPSTDNGALSTNLGSLVEETLDR